MIDKSIKILYGFSTQTATYSQGVSIMDDYGDDDAEDGELPPFNVRLLVPPQGTEDSYDRYTEFPLPPRGGEDEAATTTAALNANAGNVDETMHGDSDDGLWLAFNNPKVAPPSKGKPEPTALGCYFEESILGRKDKPVAAASPALDASLHRFHYNSDVAPAEDPEADRDREFADGVGHIP